MTVIFAATRQSTSFGFMIADDLRSTIHGRARAGTRCDKIHFIGDRYAVGGFGIETAPVAVSTLTQFPHESELRGGAPWRFPDTVHDLVQLFIPLVRTLINLQAPHVRTLPKEQRLFLEEQGGNLVILDCRENELHLCELGNILAQHKIDPKLTRLDPNQVYQFGAGPNGAPRIFSPHVLAPEIEADPWSWARPAIGKWRAVFPNLVGDWGSGVVSRSGVAVYRTAFQSPADFADRVWVPDSEE
jgi:hypothetical protein